VESYDEFKLEWGCVVEQLTEDLFDEKFKLFVKKWSSQSNELAVAMTYIENTWLPLKECFAVPWTKKLYHFGATTTQRVEGAHSVLKQILDSGAGSLSLVWETIHLMITTQIYAILSDFQDSIFRPCHVHSSNLLTRELARCVSKYALGKIFEEKERGEKHVGTDASDCGCLLRSTYGLPCAHELMILKMHGSSIQLSSIHSQWRQLFIIPYSSTNDVVSKDDEMLALNNLWTEGGETERRMLKRKIRELVAPSTTIVQEPRVVTIKKGRPSLEKKKIEDKTKKREKSSFEMARTKDVIVTPKRGRPPTILSRKGTSSKGKGVIEVDVHQTTITDILLRWIPKYIHPLIQKLTDVDGTLLPYSYLIFIVYFVCLYFSFLTHLP